VSATRVTVNQTPEVIKKLLLNHQTPGIVQIFECKSKDDFCDLAAEYPLETTSLAQRISNVIIGYFMVGIALPTSVDTFVKPVLAYYYLTDADWRVWKDEIRAEAERRKKMYMENRSAWKNLRNPN
jgi:hypothetical protein